MQQIPAFAGRKLVLFAFAAILLIWGILALDWWSINSHSSSELDGSSGEFMGVDTPSWGFLLFAIGLVATLLIVEGCRLLFGVREQANRQFALQRRMIDHAAEVDEGRYFVLFVS